MRIVEVGCTYVINGRGDLAMDGEIKPYIYQECVVVQRNKNGLFLVRPKANPNVKLSIAKKNLDPIG